MAALGHILPDDYFQVKDFILYSISCVDLNDGIDWGGGRGTVAGIGE